MKWKYTVLPRDKYTPTNFLMKFSSESNLLGFFPCGTLYNHH